MRGGSRLSLASAFLAIAFAPSGSAFDPKESSDAIVSKFLDATKIQQQALRGTQMEVDISAQLPKLKEQGRMKVLRKVSRLGQITMRKIGEFVGDKTVQHEVIERYLTMEDQQPHDSSIAITPDNYKFRLKTSITQGDSRVYVFELTPRKKIVGLFKGELWLDAATGMPLRETGTLVKNPSIFLKKVMFENEFELKNGVAWPSTVICHVDTHIAGRADLTIHFSSAAPAAEEEPAEIAEAP